MKFYDKELTPKLESIKNSILIFIIFMLGFVVGYFTMNLEKQNTIEELEEKIHIEKEKN